MFKKVETKKVYIKIVEQIRDLMQSGKLRPGDKLPPEQILAGEFGTSRPSVREALSALEILGITESRGGKGNFIRSHVSPFTHEKEFKELEAQESPFEVLEARKLIEAQVAGLAAQRATRQNTADIEKWLDEMKRTIRKIPEVIEHDREFHLSIARAVSNGILFSIVAYLTQGLKEELWMHLTAKSWSLPHRPEKRFEEHARILDAIKNKDSNTAYQRMYQHLISVENDFFGS